MKRKLFQGLICLFTTLSFAGYSDINEHGYWYGNIEGQHLFDPQLANALSNFFQREKAAVVDFGCGPGEYVKVLRKAHIYCEGYDGNPDTVTISGGVASVADLSQPLDLGLPFDWVLSLEVGEHIPQQYERTFIENIHRHNTKGVILSWAIEGQEGYGHFNNRNNDYIKKVFADLGYVNDVEAENNLRREAGCFWFKYTLMVFRRESHLLTISKENRSDNP